MELKHIELKSEGFRDERSIVLPYAVIEFLTKNEITQSLYLTDIGYYPKALGHFRSWT